jgi:hypothetical protein
MCSEKGLDESAFRMLVDHGRRRGKINRDELIDVLPDIEFDGDTIDAFVDAMADEGIPVEEEDAEAAELAAERYPEEGDAVADLSELEAEAGDISLTGVEVDDVLRMYLREAAQIPLLTRD